MLKDKALASLAAGDLLLERGIPDDAASRYYYAMYRAAVHRLTGLGFRPDAVRSGAVEWDQSMVLNNTRRLRGVWHDRCLYETMRRFRSDADYADESVEASKVEAHREAIRDFVRDLTR
jgi:uncharacterized protein (UPF0332 family)